MGVFELLPFCLRDNPQIFMDWGDSGTRNRNQLSSPPSQWFFSSFHLLFFHPIFIILIFHLDVLYFIHRIVGSQGFLHALRTVASSLPMPYRAHWGVRVPVPYLNVLARSRDFSTWPPPFVTRTSRPAQFPSLLVRDIWHVIGTLIRSAFSICSFNCKWFSIAVICNSHFHHFGLPLHSIV